ncbi:MAG TPA: CHAT domain-containing protein [Thermoanaerobaculia bacterium]|nr:CHAT domain-containing protein [Thermoanaerobaculia bacterium]
MHHADVDDPLRLLAEEPDCTDEAVEALQRISAAEPAALSDLAAAYYIRAQQQDRASDLLRAYDAVHAAPDSPEALYNRAIIEEALGVHASWDEFLEKESDSPWAAEARRRNRPRPADAAAQWDAALDAALQSRDAESASRLIAPFPGVAQVDFEDKLLTPGADLATLQRFADALYLRNHDPLARDIVQAMRTDPRGIAEYHAGRGGQRAMQNPKLLLLQASGLLRAAGNPLHLVAQLRYAAGESSELDGGALRARAILDRIEPEVERLGYHHLLARIHSLRAHCLNVEGDFVGSIAEYGHTLKQYEALRDFDSIPGTRARLAGVLRVAGDIEAAAREIVRALRDEHRIVTTREKQNVIGELSKTARALALPHAAWHYADSIVSTYRAHLLEDPAGELSRLQQELAIALKNRAAMAVELRDFDSANTDLNEARRQSEEKEIDPVIRRLTDIAFYEIQGQASLLKPPEAITAYTRALNLAEGDSFRTTRASLYAQRADAFSRAGREAEAGQDLQRTVLELEAEEREILANGGPRSSDGLPPGYYTRFQDTYLRLIRHYVDRSDVVQSLMYAEYSRGAETKKLLARLRLRGSIAGSMEHFRSIRARLPHDGALLLYSVMEDRTYVWIVTAASASVHRLEVTRQDVERWSRALYRAAQQRQLEEFEKGLEAPYAELFAPILRHVDRKRLIIVPDGAMHGLPFAALRNPDDDQYLIRKYIIETAPSATLYTYARVRDAMLQQSGAPSIMVVGNPAFDRTLPLVRGLPDLPYAEREARAIADFYGTRALTGAAATVPALLNGVEGMDLVHFAGHAVANPVTPMSSYLLMARSPEHSGVLTAGELLKGLRLDRTRLVILSACSTAGDLGAGNEGVAPLVRPILTAGVPAVIGSLWNVHDATTEQLLVSFHQHYRQHKDAAVALRDAQLAFIDSPSRSLNAGTAWAPFLVIGHASSPLAPRPQTDKGEPP